MRLFVGLALPFDLRQRFRGLCSGLPGARWVDEENMHLTLRFVGQVDASEAEDLDLALASVRVPGFPIRFVEIGSFASRSKARAVWVGAEPGPDLLCLRDTIESAVVRAGFEPEHRKFRPHVTLGRLKKGSVVATGKYLEAKGAFAAASFPVTAFTLFRSHLSHKGARYEALAEYPLLDSETAQDAVH